MESGNKPVKVAIIEPVGGHGGMDYYDSGLCYGLVAAGAEVSLYTCDETEVPANLPYLILLFYRNIFGKTNKIMRGIRYLVGTIRSLIHARINGVSILHFHYFHVGILEYFNLLLGKMLGFYCVITVHDVMSFVPELSKSTLVNLTYKLASRLIVHNQASLTELLSNNRIDAGKVSKIQSGNYLHVIKTLPGMKIAREYLDLDPDTQILLFFGQIKEAKGLNILIDALPQVLQQFPKALLLIAGKPWKDDFGKYEQQINRLSLNSNCILHLKHIPDSLVPFYFCSSNLIVLPYKRIYQSAVLLMAMSYGKPILAADLLGMTEMIKDGNTGFLFHRENPDDLAKQVIYILSNPEITERVGQNGKNLMEAEYDWAKVGQLTLECYRQTML